MFVNTYDLKNLVHLLDRREVVGQMNPSVITRPMPSAARAVFTGRRGSEVRTITVDVAVEGTSRANMFTKLDELKGRLNRGLLTVYFSDKTDRTIQGYGFVTVPNEIHPAWLQNTIPATITIVCPDPRWKQSTITTQAAASGVDLPIGTARAPLIMTIIGTAGGGAAVNPTVSYRNSANAVIYSGLWTGSLLNTDTLVIDTEFFTVKKNGANAISTFSGDFFDLNPEDGDFATSAWPDVAISVTGGVVSSFSVDYYKRWL